MVGMNKIYGKICETFGNEREHFAVSDMYKFAVEVLKAGGYPQKSAEASAYALLEADKRGIFSHGIAGGTGLEESVMRAGVTATVNPKAEPILLAQKYPAIAVIDAQGAPGPVTSMIAVELVKELARKYGIAKVYVNNANHFGAAGVWSNLIAQGDLEGIATCSTVACAPVLGDDPAGLDYTIGMGKEARMGTDPIAISIPYGDIITHDMATTRLAASLAAKCFKGNEEIKIPGYACDSEGRPTSDAKKVFKKGEDGRLELIGGFYPNGAERSGYKDQFLGIISIEMDHVLGGGPIYKAPWGGVGEKRRISHTFQAQAIDFLYTKEEAQKRVRMFMEDYGRYFGEKSRWPGDRAKDAIKYALENGIPYSQGQVDTLRRAADAANKISGEHLDFDVMVKSLGKKGYRADIFKK